MLALAEGAVGDELQEAGVVLQRADHRPAHLVGRAVEMVVAERLQAREYRVDLGLPADEGGETSFLVAARLLGAGLKARGGDRVQAVGHRGGYVVSCIVLTGWKFALSATLINSIST